MDGLSKKTLKTSRGYTYTYYTLDGDKSLPPIFFQHGWPDHAQMWEGVIHNLKASGCQFPMIIPDMLGYDGTSKPVDPTAYRWDAMTKDLIEIIDAEGYEKVVSAGHDWGCFAAARLYNFYPDRVAGMFLLNVPYKAPSRNSFDLDAFNEMTKQAFGYPCYAYWHLFTAPDGPEVMRDNLGRLYSALYADGEEAMKNLFCVPNAFREYLEGKGEEMNLRAFAKDPKFKQAFVDRHTRDGFDGPQCWYKAYKNNVQSECEATLPEGRGKVNVPVLYVGCKWDAVCRPEGMMEAKMNGWLPDLEETPLLDAAHWSPYEIPGEVAEYLGDWLKRKVGRKHET